MGIPGFLGFYLVVCLSDCALQIITPLHPMCFSQLLLGLYYDLCLC